jgi:hypothetical protein
MALWLKGHFLCQIGLQADRDKEADREAGTSVEGGSVVSPFPWHKIWQLKVPNKVQMFLWRFIHNSLLVQKNMKRRKLKTETLCPMCNRLDEDCGHLFFKCKGAQECWRALHLEELRCTLANCMSGKDVALKIWALQPETQLETVVWLWRWWTARNKANAGERVQIAEEVCNAVRYHLNEFAKLNGPNKTRNQGEQPKWKPPQEEQYKLNVDVAFSSLTRKWG